MRRTQKTFPDWWHETPMSDHLRQRLQAQFTIHRDGYLCWYRGKTRHACGRKTPPDQVEQVWRQRANEIDRIASIPASMRTPICRTYRQVLSEFLAVQHSRIGAKKNRIEQRTFDNYTAALNRFGTFTVDGTAVADMEFSQIGPREFSAYARSLSHYSASGFDSVVTLIGALFNWAAKMEYIDRYRPGPEFVRPAKADLRDDRMKIGKSFTPEQIARQYVAAGPAMRCMIALGICAAFNNSDIAHLTRDVIDLNTGIIDFRRRKVGKVRRVIPLPAAVTAILRKYKRPDPADDAYAGLFFLTRQGRPYSRTRTGKGPSCTLSRIYADLLTQLGMKKPKDRRSFSGLRTSFFNLAPRGEWELERKVIMGRAQGSIDLDSYLEDVGMDRLEHVVNHVWGLVHSEIQKLSTSPTDSLAAT